MNDTVRDSNTEWGHQFKYVQDLAHAKHEETYISTPQGQMATGSVLNAHL